MPATSLEPAPPLLLEMQGIIKTVPRGDGAEPRVVALRAGEVLALMGENGAGKSTLDEGARRRVSARRRHDPDRRARRDAPERARCAPAGHRAHSSGADARAQPRHHREHLPRQRSAAHLGCFAPVRRAISQRRTAALLERVGLRLPADTLVSTLSIGQMQMVEIAKALSLDARILVMDEPTSSLTAAESAHLFEIVRQLRADGLGIVYISHRMEEVLELADRITVLRDGRAVGDLAGRRRDARSDRGT